MTMSGVYSLIKEATRESEQDGDTVEWKEKNEFSAGI